MGLVSPAAERALASPRHPRPSAVARSSAAHLLPRDKIYAPCLQLVRVQAITPASGAAGAESAAISAAAAERGIGWGFLPLVGGSSPQLGVPPLG